MVRRRPDAVSRLKIAGGLLGIAPIKQSTFLRRIAALVIDSIE
jgi:hypothetical protein